MADAADLKSADSQGSSGFDPRLVHFFGQLLQVVGGSLGLCCTDVARWRKGLVKDTDHAALHVSGLRAA